MEENHCTNHAIQVIMSHHESAVEVHSWSGEFSHQSGGRPDKLVLARRPWLGALLFGRFHLHAVESKVDPRYFAGMNGNKYPDALHQILNYPANSQWLSVAERSLDGGQWDLLERHCRKTGVGLISCKSRTRTILCRAAEREGAFWEEYPSLIEHMRNQGWDV